MGISFNFFNALKPVHYVFSRGYDAIKKQRIGLDTGDVTAFRTFDEFYNAYLAQFHYIIEENSAYIYELEKYVNDINPSLLYAATVPRCVDTLTDANDGGISNVSDMLLNGLASAVDALMAVYELVFETHSTTLAELKDALDKNWDGYEEMRLDAIRCNGWGDGSLEASEFAARFNHDLYTMAQTQTGTYGGKIVIGHFTYTEIRFYGEKTLATPDGRKNGEYFSQGLTPSRLKKIPCVNDVIYSMSQLDKSTMAANSVVNIILPGNISLDRCEAFLRAVSGTAVQSLQLNCTSKDELLDAQKHPENYKSLVVRVAGYSALFTTLSRSLQDDIISRTEQASF
jgi:formate C-acetyltransferase